jgi:hypothetical protein
MPPGLRLALSVAVLLPLVIAPIIREVVFRLRSGPVPASVCFAIEPVSSQRLLVGRHDLLLLRSAPHSNRPRLCGLAASRADNLVVTHADTLVLVELNEELNEDAARFDLLPLPVRQRRWPG